MSQNKLKILMCSEASFLSSGFGTYVKEILSRLHATNKYTIAEFASYGTVNHPNDSAIDWIYYANAVKQDDHRIQEYNSRQDNQFGRWRFEKVLLDFKPDIVIDVRDYWMSSYQQFSPLRKFFHWILMPTVDSEPQQEPWLDTYIDADAIFTYSDWGAEVLKKQTANHINYIDTTSPGVDLQTFHIKDNKDKIKEKFGLPLDSTIIGSVMRNQKRKLIPELLISFRKLLDQLYEENHPQKDKTYLYLHTSYPDMGWDIPELIRQHRVANRVLFTYRCKNCQAIHASTFSGPTTRCKKCLNSSCMFPSVSDGITQSELAEIYNCFDLYVQYAICEGFGMPQVEAGACGIPIITVNYSAMCDVVKKIDAMPVQPKSYFTELETKAIRVYPDNDQLVTHIKEFLNLTETEKTEKRNKTRSLTEKYYNWDDAAKKWEKYFDVLDKDGYRADWSKAINIIPELGDVDTDHIDPSSNYDVMVNICQKSLKDIDAIGSYHMLDMLCHADYGFVVQGMSPQRVEGLSKMIEYVSTFIKNNNLAENVRSNNLPIEEDFISYAKIKNETK